MSDLISREATKMIITMKPYDWSNITERREMLNEIDNLPSVELEERAAKVKEGWGLAVCECEKRVFPNDVYCSGCGARLEWNE